MWSLPLTMLQPTISVTFTEKGGGANDDMSDVIPPMLQLTFLHLFYFYFIILYTA